MKRFDTYADALGFLYRRNQFSIKLGLENMQAFLEGLGNPHRNLAYIHVAGTNGKGSTCKALEAIAPLLGYRQVALYTSPHLVSFRERIVVRGRPIEEDFILTWMNNNVHLIDTLNTTYFECVTAMAFTYFKEQACDLVVLETGLGGRLDATNVITPLLTMITPVSLDHCAILGDTVEKIWIEKLGILKAGVPIVVDEERESLLNLLKSKADALNVPVYNLADHRIELDTSSNTNVYRYHGLNRSYAFEQKAFPAEHAFRNAMQALLACELLENDRVLKNQVGVKELPLEKESALAQVLYTARLPGRLQRLEAPGFRTLILDGAHNPAALKAMIGYLRRRPHELPMETWFASMRDKDYLTSIQDLSGLSSEIKFASLDFARALAYSEFEKAVQGMLPRFPISPLVFDEIPALLRNSEKGPVLICGSFYLLGAIIPRIAEFYPGLASFQQFSREPF